MCDVSGAAFFRPWDAVESLSALAKQCVKSPAKDGSAVPAAKAARQSVVSKRSLEEHRADRIAGCGDSFSGVFRNESRRESKSSSEVSSSASSVVGEDVASLASLDTRYRFDLVSPSKAQSSLPASIPAESVPQVLSTSTVFHCWQAPTSAFAMDCLQQLALHHPNTYAALEDGPTVLPNVEPSGIRTSTIATTGQPFCYGYPALHLAQGLYQTSMEVEMEMLQRQDAAAKHMKKLRPKKFRCEHCDVAFSNNGQLKGHIRIHTGERPFRCDAADCGKSFTRNEELTRHKRIHTGLRPHACLVCGKRFGRKDHLRKHSRTHVNRDAYRVSAAALSAFALGHPFPSHVYPM